MLHDIYLLQEKKLSSNKTTGNYKIGKTIDKHTRRNKLNTGNPRKLEIIATFQNDSGISDTTFKKIFINQHICNDGGDEWYDFSNDNIIDIISTISNYCSGFKKYKGEIYDPDYNENDKNIKDESIEYEQNYSGKDLERLEKIIENKNKLKFINKYY